MKLPRDLSGREMAKCLKVLGYKITRQIGSHIRLTTSEGGEHHVTIPDHDSLRIGTLVNILNEVSSHFKMSREEIVRKLFK